jgi:hypothetical protein
VTQRRINPHRMGIATSPAFGFILNPDPAAPCFFCFPF